MKQNADLDKHEVDEIKSSTKQDNNTPATNEAENATVEIVDG